LNEENLIPFNDMTQRERSEIARKGAIASNKKQKEKKMMREVVQEVMKMQMNADLVGLMRDKLPFLEDGMDYQTAMILGQVKSAIDGNSKAFELLSEFNDTQNGNKANEYNELSVDELRGLLDGIKPGNGPKD
jgi:hypothetical protein